MTTPSTPTLRDVLKDALLFTTGGATVGTGIPALIDAYSTHPSTGLLIVMMVAAVAHLISLAWHNRSKLTSIEKKIDQLAKKA